MKAIILAVGVLVFSVVPATGTDDDPTVPTPAAVLGYELGQWVTDYAGMESYFSALAEASPRVVFGSYGTDYEHRRLRYAIVSSPSNIQRLDAVREATERMTDPRTLDASDAEALIERTPLVVWLNYCTDGNETAGLESALMMAHHLAASQDAATAELLDEAVVILTPIMNPSSHERWTSWSNSFAARGGNPDPQAMEHNPPWGVLTNNNHYLVDLNRESLWATQRESAALRDFYYQWNPAIFVDHHGEYDDFAGPGYTEPLNPLFTPAQRRWLTRMGEVIAKRFGERAWSYSPWETGTFYPGFWESIGLINGAVGFTYETIGGGSKGLRYQRDDGSIITLLLAAEQHFQASLAVLETAVAARRELLSEFVDYFRTALTLDQRVPEKLFIIDPSDAPERAERLIDVLLANRVEVYRTPRDLEAPAVRDYLDGSPQTRTVRAGAYLIPVAQPRARLLLTLMRKDLRLPEPTLEAAERFRRDQETAGFRSAKVGKTTYLFYDVTAWSMPLTYGVPAAWVEQPIPSELERVTSLPAHAPVVPSQPADYGYLFPGHRLGSVGLMADLLQQDIVLNVAYSGFTIGGRAFPRGSLLVRRERNPDMDLLQVLGEAAQRHRVNLYGVDSPHSQTGPSLGSDQFVHLASPRIAVLAGDPVSTSSFGSLWFILERLYGVAFTAIYKEQLDAETLHRYDVLVLPHGWYGDQGPPSELVETLKGWISRGGTLVCLKGAARWAAEVGLTSARLRPPEWPPAAADPTPPRETPSIPGAILRTEVNPHHYLTLGYRQDTPVLVRSNLAFEPDPDLAAPLWFAGREEIQLAGFAYGDSLDRLAETPYVIVEPIGSGKIVLFLDDPGFRVYWFGLHRLLLNSLLVAPSF